MPRWISTSLWVSFLMGAVTTCITADDYVAHASHDRQSDAEFHDLSGSGYEIPGLSFRVFVEEGMGGPLDQAQAEAALRTVIDTFSHLYHIGIPIRCSMKP